MNRKRWMEIGMAALLLWGAYWLSGEGTRLVSESAGAAGSLLLTQGMGDAACAEEKREGRLFCEEKEGGVLEG